VVYKLKRPNLFLFDQIDREVETTCNAPSVPKSAKKEVYQQLDDLKAESKHLVIISTGLKGRDSNASLLV
jgi:hypothetical protein